MDGRASDSPRPSVEVVCTGCGVTTTVPFQPTAGRPVYCRACFAQKAPAQGAPRARPSRPREGGDRAPFRERDAPTPRKRMLSQGRKAYFVYDALEALGAGTMIQENRRVFVEMLFTRGVRQSTASAHQFLDEKVADKTITDREAKRLAQIVEQYSFYR